MPGPSLRQLHAHHAIHQGGLSGAVAKTEEVEELLEAKEFEVAHQAAEHLIEYWETRIISHAAAEEDGVSQEMAGMKTGFWLRRRDLISSLQDGTQISFVNQ
mgnify:CR=1 FL=1